MNSTLATLLKRPSAFLPLAMSGFAVALLLLQITAALAAALPVFLLGL